MKKVINWLKGEVNPIEFYVVMAILIGFMTFSFLRLDTAMTAVENIETILGK